MVGKQVCVASSDLQHFEFIFLKHYIELYLINNAPEAGTHLNALSVCVCVFTSSDICPDCDLCLSSSLLRDVFCLSSCSTLRAR